MTAIDVVSSGRPSPREAASHFVYSEMYSGTWARARFLLSGDQSGACGSGNATEDLVRDQYSMLRGYQGKFPQLGTGVFIDDSAQVIGDVVIGDHSSVWFNTVVRGDVFYVRIGNSTNIQDSCVLHVTRDRNATILGDYVSVGHGVILHGCTVESHCLIGMGAIVMDKAVVGEGTIVGAGSLVTQGLKVPPRSLVLGSPAKVVRQLSAAEVESIDRYANNYLMYKENYLKEKG